MLAVLPPNPPVPFYSQFENITLPDWRGKGCGVTDLAMVVNYYQPGATTVDKVLEQAVAADGYIENIGWTYKSLIAVAAQYGLEGDSYDWGKLSTTEAFKKFETLLNDGPVIASVHYKFDPANPIPHLVVITNIDGTDLYYNDPALNGGGKKIPIDKFLKAWKKRLVVIRPPETVAFVDKVKASQSVADSAPIIVDLPHSAMVGPEQRPRPLVSILIERITRKASNVVDCARGVDSFCAF